MLDKDYGFKRNITDIFPAFIETDEQRKKREELKKLDLIKHKIMELTKLINKRILIKGDKGYFNDVKRIG